MCQLKEVRGQSMEVFNAQFFFSCLTNRLLTWAFCELPDLAKYIHDLREWKNTEGSDFRM